jgi:hypothetical protein
MELKMNIKLKDLIIPITFISTAVAVVIIAKTQQSQPPGPPPEGEGEIVLRNPTYSEMEAFILYDLTDKHEYIPGEYECADFAADVVNNAAAAGWLCGFALLYFEEGQHAVVVFNTTDRGLIYIEPETDDIVDVYVGGTYGIYVNDIYTEYEIKRILIVW